MSHGPIYTEKRAMETILRWCDRGGEEPEWLCLHEIENICRKQLGLELLRPHCTCPPLPRRWHKDGCPMKSADPFERAKDIRKGKLDAEMPSYEDLTGWLGRVPMTWLPGLLIRTVEMCVIRRVFKDGAILPVVERAIEKTGDYFRTTKDTNAGDE